LTRLLSSLQAVDWFARERQVVKGANPSSVSLEFFDRSFVPKSTLVPAVFNKTASASNPHIDVWTANVDSSTLTNIGNVDLGL
jgi:hypothetical protein